MTYDMTLFLILDTVHKIWMNMMNDFFVRWSSKEMAKHFKTLKGCGDTEIKHRMSQYNCNIHELCTVDT